ncbi:hypothetical protein GE061_009857 [Apolygus lucorum]|uniref:MADF domain-containing protein n=1 Tax=Apolygus lucorum TaxID=248454 RepID=A0A6A4K3H0_APOLU|nr:hypothetical protein GE061_009857 [Apolygus lucorum]
MDDLLLIHAVREREVLWNPSHKSHKNVHVLKASWVEVATILTKSVKLVKTRWKNIRAYFCSLEDKKISFMQDGHNPPPITWPLYSSMLFLKDIYVPSSRQGGRLKEVEITCISDDDQSSLQDPLAPVDSPQSIDSNSDAENSQTENDSENNLESHRSEMLALKRRKIELLEKASQDKDKSDDLLFFESLLPYMAQVPPIVKLKLRSSIQDLILEQLLKTRNCESE